MPLFFITLIFPIQFDRQWITIGWSLEGMALLWLFHRVELGGNLARDMTYSMGWALFALGLLTYGIRKKVPAARYPARGLLSVTLVKLFFHDLAQLGQLYRIGAPIGVAVIAMLASFAYQEFFAAGDNEKSIGNETPH